MELQEGRSVSPTTSTGHNGVLYSACAAEGRPQMIREFQRVTLLIVPWLTIFSVSAWCQSNLDRLKSEYQSVISRLEKHLVFDWWIDDDPESPNLLARHWSLAGEFVAAWLNAYPLEGLSGVKAALLELAPQSQPEYLQLGGETYLVVHPGPIGNVFIVTKLGGRYRVAWSTAQVQKAQGKQAEVLAAWRPENARHGDRGPYWAASGSAGSVIPRIGKLPDDAKGRPRFYIDGTYAQSAGATVGAQISVWLWNGDSAEPLIVRPYTVMLDQTVGTRLEGDLLKVRQKKFFRSFFSCGSCEERQTDWTVRLTPEGVEDVGEYSVVPDLDAADELFDRVIHNKSAADIAAPPAIKAAERIVAEARAGRSEKQWKEFPTLGMMGEWIIQNNKNSKVLCLSVDDAGTMLFTLKPTDGRLFIVDLRQTDESCRK